MDDARFEVYFLGIGGIGMSALARYFLSKKWPVSGSDAVRSTISDSLIKEGVKVKIGHKTTNLGPKTGLVIYNRAIAGGPGKIELDEAYKRGVPVVPYAQILGEITKGHTTIAITGSHGKTTTTAFAGIMLAKNNFDPTVLVGSNLKEFGGKNIRIGKSPFLVLEADDFGAAFLEYVPRYAIVTNIDREHLDFYKTFGNLKNAFIKFLSRIEPRGAMILNQDDEHLWSLHTRIGKIAKARHVKVIWYSAKTDPLAKKIKSRLQLAGDHNTSNALAAYKLGRHLNIPEAKILSALHAYQGAWRRMEYRGDFKGAKVFDDYAHHPTEIKATLQAFREKFPKSRLVCVFEPHQTKRLEALFKEFQTAFTEADTTIILPVYKVAGRNEHAKRDSRTLVAAMKKKFPSREIFYLSSPKQLRTFLSKKIMNKPSGPTPVIIMMGAGTIVNATAGLVKN